jgi:TRAP-type C4-dicarboxylate transport system permease small subunit
MTQAHPLRVAVDRFVVLVERLGAVLVIALVALLFANVVAREGFEVSLVWANEISLILFAWTVFLGAGVAFARGARIRFTFLADRLPPARRAWADAMTTWVGILILAILFVTACQIATLNASQRLTSIDASALWQWASLPAGIAVALIGWIARGPWTGRMQGSL